MTKKYNESVLVVPSKEVTETSNIFELGSHASFLDRNLAELDINHRQIIPYVFITDMLGRILIYRRKTGDSRLKDKYSIGFGGHINPIDADISVESGENALSKLDIEKICYNNIRRELEEELHMSDPEELQQLIKTDTLILKNETEVDKMHVGIVYHLLNNKIRGRVVDGRYNQSEMFLEFVKLENLLSDDIMFNKLESWSQTLIASLRNLL